LESERRRQIRPHLDDRNARDDDGCAASDFDPSSDRGPNGFRADAGIAQQAMAKVVPAAGGGGSTGTIKKTTYTLGAGGAGGSSPGNSGAAGPAVATLSSP
jgi:hypothetical protein